MPQWRRQARGDRRKTGLRAVEFVTTRRERDEPAGWKSSPGNPSEIEPHRPQLGRRMVMIEAAHADDPSPKVASDAGQVYFDLSFAAHKRTEDSRVSKRKYLHPLP